MMVYALAGLGLVGVAQPGAWAADKAKPSADVEAKVTDVLKKAYPEVVITSMAVENEDGVDVIGVTFTTKGNKMDADVTPDGILFGTEEPGDITKFPKPAAKTLKAALAKDLKDAATGMTASYEIAKSFAKGEKDATGTMKVVKLDAPVVAYEADVAKDGKKGEYSVSADGKILESPSWASGEKDDKD